MVIFMEERSWTYYIHIYVLCYLVFITLQGVNGKGDKSDITTLEKTRVKVYNSWVFCIRDILHWVKCLDCPPSCSAAPPPPTPPPLGEAGGIGVTMGGGLEEGGEGEERRERWWMCHKRKFNTETLWLKLNYLEALGNAWYRLWRRWLI